MAEEGEADFSTNVEIKTKITVHESARIIDICDQMKLIPTQLAQTDFYLKTTKPGLFDCGNYLKYRVCNGNIEFIEYSRWNDAGEGKISYYNRKETDFKAFGLDLEKRPVIVTVNKNRVFYLWSDNQTRIHLDVVDRIPGVFLELEVVLKTGQNEEEGQKIAKDLLDKFNIIPKPLARSYSDIILESKTQSRV